MDVCAGGKRHLLARRTARVGGRLNDVGECFGNANQNADRSPMTVDDYMGCSGGGQPQEGDEGGVRLLAVPIKIRHVALQIFWFPQRVVERFSGPSPALFGCTKAA